MSLELHNLTHEAVESSEKFIKIHKKQWVKSLDKSIIYVSILGPIMTLPQLYEVWINKSIDGVSISTWSLYCVMSLFWIFYGFAHKDKPIIINQCLWMVVQVAIVAGILFHR